MRAAIKRKDKKRGICAKCSEPFARTQPAQKYCDKHSTKKYQKVKKEDRTCTQCEKKFKASVNRVEVRFCSKKCRQAWWSAYIKQTLSNTKGRRTV